MELKFDDRDLELAEVCQFHRDQIEGPRLGDFVRFQTGEIERFSHNSEDAMQTSPITHGSFFLSGCGHAQFSGSLNPFIPKASLVLTEETQDGTFWFFHHGQVGAGRGVRFRIPCRVFSSSARYEGYLSKNQANER
jgi:hypothetical protein